MDGGALSHVSDGARLGVPGGEPSPSGACDRRSPDAALVTAFGTTVAMWAIAYVGRLPAVLLPSPILLALLVVCLLGGGVFVARHAPGVRFGLAVGAVTGVLCMLVLGGLVSDAGGKALLWIPGSIVACASIAGLGAWLGQRIVPSATTNGDWSGAFVRVAVAATMLLLAVGGLVTSAEAGLAVADWPNTFGYNMFLYPLSRMTGGIYYEHAHRLFGALVGLTTLVLAAYLQRTDDRVWVRRTGWAVFGLVVAQGILGGLRVTGGFTLSQEPSELAPNRTLALVHGVLAQLFFATLVALAVFTSRSWRAALAPRRAAGPADRIMASLLLLLVVVQLVLGSAQRHFGSLLVFHVVTGVALVAPLALHVGVRAAALHPVRSPLRRCGLLLTVTVAIQLALGFFAYVSTVSPYSDRGSPGIDLLAATSHQWFGAMVLGLTVILLCWSFRPASPALER